LTALKHLDLFAGIGGWTLTAFERWLDALSANLGALYQVGKALNQCKCPLAVFLAEELGTPIYVTQSGVDTVTAVYYHTPLTRSFTGHIDCDRLPLRGCAQRCRDRKNNQPVTLAQAKQALKAARQAIKRGDKS